MSTSSAASPTSLYFEMTFRPNAALISLVRRLVADFYKNQMFPDPDVASRLALATHELLENAIKYGEDDETSVRVEIAPDADAGQALVTIRTMNRAASEHIAVLGRCVAQLGAREDALAHYQSLLRSATDSGSGSGLGLARIRAEAEMSIRHEVRGDRVWVVAEGRIEGTPPR